MNKKELATTNNSFMTLAGFNLAEALAEELAGLDGGFERIKIPAAGSTVFEIPGEEPGETDTVKEFSAVMLFQHPLFAYYRDPYAGGNNPPDCGSFDGMTGEGNPGGTCDACPLNQFGSAGQGKACKNRRRIYVLREGELLPMLLSLPTGSIKEFGRYVKRLLAKGKKTNMVVTKFSLQKAVNAGGITYSQAQFAMERHLTDEEYALIAPISEQVKQRARVVSYEVDNAPQDIGPIIDLETGEIIEPLS